MNGAFRSNRALWLSRLRRNGQLRTLGAVALIVLGPILVAITFLALGPLNQGASSPTLRLILLGDMVYVLVLAALVLRRVVQMVSDRRSQSAGSRLHLRLTGVFAIVALIPTVLVAVFGVLTVNIGLEGWFSDRVRSVVGASLEAAQAYEVEQSTTLTQDAQGLADILNGAQKENPLADDGAMRPVLVAGQASIQRGLSRRERSTLSNSFSTR